MRNLSKTMLAVLATSLLSCGLFCEQAHAVSGSVLFSGGASASGASGAGTTTITFANPWTVIGADGDYTGTEGSLAIFTNFSFTGTGTGATLIGTVIPEWTFSFGGNTYSFDLLSLLSGTTTTGSIALSGTGIAYINGGDATAANWSLEGTGNGFIDRKSVV